jgi:hypothetical protein
VKLKPAPTRYSVIAVELYGGISDQFFDFKAAMFSMYQV